MHCQKPSCLKALTSSIFVSSSIGLDSKIVSSFLRYLKKFELTTKNPPFIQLSPTCIFSLNFLTLVPSKLNDPNLAGGLTAVIVKVFLCS